MVDVRVARRYARALFEVALKQQQLQQTADDLTALRRLMEQSSELRTFFYSPLIPRDRKIARLREALSTQVQLHILRLLELLVEKRREKFLVAVCDEFQRLQEAHQGVVRATIVSAVPLTADEQNALVQKLEQSTGKRIIPTFEVQPELIGGVRVQMGDYQIDGTLRGALDRLRDHIMLEIERRGARVATTE
ncbi:MAG: ATP synthase F1 subunit delta [Armatimonadetes bacterium CP1_7O]|nr:MAG: ATP synthase F1 subunit delta [Armatimonadetes bacterium CP1_7O]